MEAKVWNPEVRFKAKTVGKWLEIRITLLSVDLVAICNHREPGSTRHRFLGSKPNFVKVG
jgi:hypothetical protein